MFFGEEGERLLQQRQAAQRQYAEDLKAQIAEKQNKPKSPPYTPPSNQESNSSRPPSLLQQVHQTGSTRPTVQPSTNSRLNALSNNPNTIQRPPSDLNRAASPKYDPLPDLAPVSSGPSPDAIRFADRLNWLESSVEQHQSILKSASDSASRIERTSLPSISDGIEQLRSAIDRISTVDLPARIRPLEDENQRLEEKIQSASTEFSNIAQSLRERLTETSSVFTQTQSKFSEFSDSVKSTILEFKSEVMQARDAHDAISQRIVQAESKAAQTEETLRSVSIALQNFEKSATDGIASAQQSINSMVQTTSLQLAQQLKTESEGRDQASNLLHSQAEEVNQRAAQSVSNIQNHINDLAISFKQSLSTLSSSVRDALETTRTESENQYHELSDRLDQILTETDNNFSTVQSESISTLQTLNEHAIKAREELEAALTQECEVRKKNEEQIVQRYDNFKALIINEMQMQTTQMEDMSVQAAQKVTKLCNSKVLPLKNEIAEVREKTRGAEQLPAKVAAIEQLVGQINAQLIENVGALGQKSSAIISTIDKMRSESEQAIDQLNERLRALEDNQAKPDFVTRQDVNNAFTNLNSDFDNRMQEIEQQIGIIFSNLSELTMNTPAPQSTQEPGAKLLDQLAKQDS